MITYILIPHLLGIMMSPNQTVHQGVLEYTFQVDAKWWFSDFHHLKENIYLSVDLICHRAGVDLLCRLENWRVRQRTQKGRDLMFPGSLYMERTSDQEALQNDSRPFHIVFDQRGVVGYFVKGDRIPRRIMNLYRIIGNQLNIGVDIQQEEEIFEVLEHSNVGFCYVRYTKMTQKPPLIGPVGNLTSLIGFDLATNTTTILKRKIIPRCTVLTRRSVAASFWPDLFPQSTASHVLTKSVSSMTMSLRGFETLSENEFNLYDENNQIVGDISEKVELYLKSYRVLPPDSPILLNEDQVVFYQVLNDETDDQRTY